MVRFALEVGYPYGPQDQCCYDRNKESGCWQPKIVFETKVQPVQGKPCKMAATNEVSIGWCVGMIVIRCMERALRYERMIGRALESRTAR